MTPSMKALTPWRAAASSKQKAFAKMEQPAITDINPVLAKVLTCDTRVTRFRDGLYCCKKFIFKGKTEFLNSLVQISDLLTFFCFTHSHLQAQSQRVDWFHVATRLRLVRTSFGRKPLPLSAFKAMGNNRHGWVVGSLAFGRLWRM